MIPSPAYNTGVSFDSSHTVYAFPRPEAIKFSKNQINNTTLKTVPPTFYFNSIGFFCQKELQIEKALKHSVLFRLGSVDYTNKIEGKR